MQTSPGLDMARCDQTHECSEGNTDTSTSGFSLTRSPPATAINWSSGIPWVCMTRTVVGPDDLRTGPAGDTLGAPQVVEMGVADHDEVAAVDVVGDQAGPWGSVDPVDVGVQEHDETADRQPEG